MQRARSARFGNAGMDRLDPMSGKSGAVFGVDFRMRLECDDARGG
jgi:hypothetical protein